MEYYDDEYLIRYNRYKQRLKNSKKHILTISKNYAIVNDKNDKYSMKAITSKRLYNRKKDFVSLNKNRHNNFLTEIDESLGKTKNIKFLNKTTYTINSNKNKINQKTKSLYKLKLHPQRIKKNLIKKQNLYIN